MVGKNFSVYLILRREKRIFSYTEGGKGMEEYLLRAYYALGLSKALLVHNFTDPHNMP